MKIQYFIILLSFVLSINRSEAQIHGCTDRLAVNYDPSATVNDGSCIYNPANAEPSASFILSGALAETSGLIFWNDQLWTHNDNIDINIYSLDTINGTIVHSYPLSGLENNDWEEISQDADYIYVGDFGNNSGNRKDLKILKISKNSLLNNSPVLDSIMYSYSDQVDFTPSALNTDFDCEAFIVSDDSIYLFTKQWKSNKTSLYSLPKIPGSYVAKLRSSYDVQGLITGSVYLGSEKIIALSGYSKNLDPFIFLLYDFNDVDFFSGNKRKISISLPFHQIEGIATGDGIKYYISNEYFSPNPLISIRQKLHIFNLSPFLGNYLNIAGPQPDDQNNFIVSPVPAHEFINVRSYATRLPADYSLINLSGQVVMAGRLASEYSTIAVSGLATGFYILKIGAEKKNSYRVIKE